MMNLLPLDAELGLGSTAWPSLAGLIWRDLSTLSFNSANICQALCWGYICHGLVITD